MKTGISTTEGHSVVPTDYQGECSSDGATVNLLPGLQREERRVKFNNCTVTLYLTQAEVASKFRVTQSTVKNWREKGLLQYLRVPGSTRVLYPVDSVEELEHQSLHQEKEVVRPKEIKRERPGISPRQQKEWRI